jgi:YbbR domain-containing protein
MIEKIRKFFTRNLSLKLVSFLFALVLWFSLIPEEKTFSEKTLTVPLELHNIPSDMELVERPIQTVDVTIRAPNRLIPQLSSANVHTVLDMQKASVAQEEYSLNRSMVSIPEGAEVKEIYPSKINLKFEKSKEIMLEVKPNVIGTLPEEYTLLQVEVIPPEVLVKGPESIVDSQKVVRTSPVDISGLTQSTEMEADLILPDPDLSLTSPKNTVLIRLQISKNDTAEKVPGKTPQKK